MRLSYFSRMIYGETNRITRTRSGMVIMMEAMFDTTGFLSKKKATKVPNHLRGVHSRYADKTEMTEIDRFR